MTKSPVLGTDFITDVLLVAIRVDAPLTLIPGVLATDVALRTVCEALIKAACARLELEANELHAEYRPALTSKDARGVSRKSISTTHFPAARDSPSALVNLGSQSSRKHSRSSRRAPTIATAPAIAACAVTRTSSSTTYWTATSERVCFGSRCSKSHLR
jgi:hypothetical protein